MSDTIVKLDSRGRATIAKHVRKNGIPASEYWALTYGENQAVILTPVTFAAQKEVQPA